MSVFSLGFVLPLALDNILNIWTISLIDWQVLILYCVQESSLFYIKFATGIIFERSITFQFWSFNYIY